jgi:serine/threonine protein kinase
MAARAGPPPIPEFSIRAKLGQFVPNDFSSWDDAFDGSPGGCFGRAVKVVWWPPQGGNVKAILKLMPGAKNAARARQGESTRDAFESEVDILQKVRAVATRWAIEAVGHDGPAPHTIGLGHLSFTYCTGWEEDASVELPSHAVRGAPLFLIAMEPLEGGSLWARMRINPNPPDSGPAPVFVGQPLPPEQALRAAADLMAGLSALHKLGYAHADLK